MSPTIDSLFLALKPDNLATIALDTLRAAKVQYGDFRLERVLGQTLNLHDLALETVLDETEIGYGVRVIIDGAWGFAASTDLAANAVRQTALKAINVAKHAARLTSEAVELAPEPIHSNGHYISSYETNPFDVPINDKIALLNSLSRPAQNAKNIDHTDFSVRQAMENKYFANLDGTSTNQQRVRVLGQLTAVSVDKKTGRFGTMRTCSLPSAQGWEYFTTGYDFASEIAQMPAWLNEKMQAPSVKAGAYDLVIDPTNLWLTIHESVGHATELDRVLGYEANYAGTSFATLDKLNKLQYGSKLMHITGDRNTEHGLASIDFDDEGVATGQWDIIKDGVLRGYQLNRQMAAKLGMRSNGCTFADSFSHIPLQRMPNVSLQPAATDTTLDDLIGQVENGIYVIGDNSWSIDMQRYNFQFTGQRFYAIKNGKLGDQLQDVAYQSNTVDFWNKLDGLGGASTYLLGGAFNCGKGQPGQVAAVSHGAPATLFRNVKILNTASEGKS